MPDFAQLVPDGRLTLQALRRLSVGPFSLDLAPGECCAVTGPSGVGKSLFLRMIADLDPHQGGAWLGDMDRAAVAAPIWRRTVMYVQAESGWWAERVGTHFAAAADLPDLLGELGLPAEALDWPVRRLSTGERQRLAFLRAVVQRPRVLLLDEPTSALDDVTTLKLEGICQGLLRQGTILVLVSHDEAQADRMATSRMRLERGRTLEAA